MKNEIIESGIINSGIIDNGILLSGVNFLGIDFICAALTLAYIAKLVFHTVGCSNVIDASCCVAKISLRGQQVVRRGR
jgi:hypothetical protein